MVGRCSVRPCCWISRTHGDYFKLSSTGNPPQKHPHETLPQKILGNRLTAAVRNIFRHVEIRGVQNLLTCLGKFAGQFLKFGVPLTTYTYEYRYSHDDHSNQKMLPARAPP